MAELKENAIEWITGQDTISVTVSQKKYVNRVERLAKKFPDLVQIKARNDDGSIFAHLPLKALKLNITVSNMTEEQKKANAERLRKLREEM